MTQDLAPPPMQVTEEVMAKEGIEMAFRDTCVHLLIPLNKCRQKTLFAPWKCDHERHAYEKCQYVEYKKRVAQLEASKASSSQ